MEFVKSRLLVEYGKRRKENKEILSADCNEYLQISMSMKEL